MNAGVFGAAPLSSLALAVVLGTAFGLGAWFLIALLPRWRALPLERRIAPYVRDVTDPRGMTPWLTTDAWASPTIGRAFAAAGIRFAALFGGSATIARRLAQAGRAGGVEGFRARQLAWGIGGLLVGSVVLIGVSLAGGFTPVVVAVPAIAALAGVVLCDVLLQRAAAARRARLQEELPPVLEFLGLCLAAGESLLDALRRVGSIGSGELSRELAGVVLEAGTGSSLGESLGALSRRLELPAFSRAVDQLVAALDRGAPLVHVLQAQAHDAREAARHELIERAGRSEILMLVPLVFLILPLSVIYAVYPGVFMLRLGLG
ncbi:MULTISPECIES: type II secretion system F family protein [unclassified Microbacterium]|uniref:type II secretion system F family protein n=1 Tax=unclassified Microbacterium TaxID=2609290 RepID=UPI000C2BDD50|nr:MULTISPECIES: type II secretion system F family protein [unclassified Microbacterium]